MWQRTKNIYHLLMAVVANAMHFFPSRRLKVIGVTGTDGKTTTANLIYHILKNTGKEVALVSTINAIIGEKEYDTGFHVTTPSSFALLAFIRKAVSKGEYLVLEVTSHAIDQQRVWGIHFTVGVLTNVSHEHLDYHKTYENYVATKAKLLQWADVAITNRDDESYRLISNNKKQITKNKWITYGMDKGADVNPTNFPFETSLIGDFNAYNILAAIAVCQSLGLPNEQIRSGIVSFTAPVGRQEIIYDKDFTVVIDFAHTPHAFEVLLPEMRKLTSRRLIHIFGAPAKRDTSKRPLMGKVASTYDDIMILTAEDPRGESVADINKEIEGGIMNYESRITNKTLYEIPNRKEAIQFAVNLAKKGDTIILTGKGHERSMNYNGTEEPWSEHEAVQNALRNRR